MRSPPTLLTGVLALGLSTFSPCSAQSADDLAERAQQYAERFGPSVFFVEAMRPGEQTPERIGTATLIDARGYFLTASHTLALASTRVENDAGCEHLDGTVVLRLRNEEGLTLLAHGYRYAPYGRLDLAIVRAEPAQAPTLTGINVPDLAIGDARQSLAADQAMVLGFRLNGTALQTTAFHRPSTRNNNPTFEIPMLAAFHGYSGAPAFDRDGRIMGVLIGPRPERCEASIAAEEETDDTGATPGEAITFTRLSSRRAKMMLQQIPAPSRADEIAAGVRGQSQLSAELARDLNAGAIPSMDVSLAAVELQTNPVGASDDLDAQVRQRRTGIARISVRAAINAAEHRYMNAEANIFASFCPDPLDASAAAGGCEEAIVETFIGAMQAALSGANDVDAGETLGEVRTRFTEFSRAVRFDQMRGPRSARLWSAAYALHGQVLERTGAQQSEVRTTYATATHLDPLNRIAWLQWASFELGAGELRRANERYERFVLADAGRRPGPLAPVGRIIDNINPFTRHLTAAELSAQIDTQAARFAAVSLDN